jgi:hypothetical protein
MASEQSEEDLRLRYLDWCSTQVAKRFLELSLDEVWVRSHDAATRFPSGEQIPSGEQSPATDPDGPAGVDRIPTYLELVRKTALLLAQEMRLPPFAEWKEAYLEDPSTFEQDILR